MSFLLPLLLIGAAYLIGSIPFSYLVGRILKGEDIRSLGSGNVGATNVLRNFGKRAGLIALTLDLLKGWLSIQVALRIVSSPAWPYPFVPRGGFFATPSFWIGLAGALAVLGHMMPPWLGFRGGKGVATAAGVFAALDPVAMAFVLLVFFVVVTATRYVSLASILAAASMPLLERFLTHQRFWYEIFAIVIALAIIFRHRENIARLVAGTEPKLGERGTKE